MGAPDQINQIREAINTLKSSNTNPAEFRSKLESVQTLLIGDGKGNSPLETSAKALGLSPEEALALKTALSTEVARLRDGILAVHAKQGSNTDHLAKLRQKLDGITQNIPALQTAKDQATSAYDTAYKAQVQPKENALQQVLTALQETNAGIAQLDIQTGAAQNALRTEEIFLTERTKEANAAAKSIALEQPEGKALAQELEALNQTPDIFAILKNNFTPQELKDLGASLGRFYVFSGKNGEKSRIVPMDKNAPMPKFSPETLPPNLAPYVDIQKQSNGDYAMRLKSIHDLRQAKEGEITAYANKPENRPENILPKVAEKDPKVADILNRFNERKTNVANLNAQIQLFGEQRQALDTTRAAQNTTRDQVQAEVDAAKTSIAPLHVTMENATQALASATAEQTTYNREIASADREGTSLQSAREGWLDTIMALTNFTGSVDDLKKLIAHEEGGVFGIGAKSVGEIPVTAETASTLAKAIIASTGKYGVAPTVEEVVAKFKELGGKTNTSDTPSLPWVNTQKPVVEQFKNMQQGRPDLNPTAPGGQNIDPNLGKGNPIVDKYRGMYDQRGADMDEAVRKATGR